MVNSDEGTSIQRGTISPHRNEALNCIQVFADTLTYTGELDFNVEFQKLQDDLTVIYN